LDHLAEETIQEIEHVLHTNERPSRGLFHDGRGTDYRTTMVEMHISEIGFCAGHSASGVWINEKGETTVPGLYGAGDMASIPHSYMLGAFVYGQICGENATQYALDREFAELDVDFIIAERDRILAPLKRTDGIPPSQFEYKVRRLVNDYLQPPKVTKKMDIGLARLRAMEADIEHLYARDAHELLRANEAQHVFDCAKMAAVASMFRTESRWGLYHNYVDYPKTDNDKWFCHVQLFKDENNEMACSTIPVEPYVVELDEQEKNAYQQMRVQAN
jgi:succinate dehydrogenase/fumarate reductase flavoprotein subunit